MRNVSHAGEVAEYMMVLSLNKLGKAFLEVNNFVSQNQPYADTRPKSMNLEGPMKNLKLNGEVRTRTFTDEYTLDPAEKYVINLEEEMEIQLAIMMSFQVMGPPPASKELSCMVI